MSNLVFSGKAVFPDGEDAIGSRVFLTNKPRKKLFSPPKRAAIVDATGNWSITVPKADLIKIPGQKMIYAISSEDGRTWREFIKAGQKYDIDFKDDIKFQHLSNFPSIRRDLSLLVHNTVPYMDIKNRRKSSWF